MTDADLIAAIRKGDVLFVTIADLEAVTGLSRMTPYRLVRDGSLEARYYGPRSIRVPVGAAREFLSNGCPQGSGHQAGHDGAHG